MYYTYTGFTKCTCVVLCFLLLPIGIPARLAYWDLTPLQQGHIEVLIMMIIKCKNIPARVPEPGGPPRPSTPHFSKSNDLHPPTF